MSLCWWIGLWKSPVKERMVPRKTNHMIRKLEPSIFREKGETRNLTIKDQQFDQTYLYIKISIRLQTIKSIKFLHWQNRQCQESREFRQGSGNWMCSWWHSLYMYVSLHDKLEVCSCILANYQTQQKNPDNVSTSSMSDPHLPLKIQPGGSLLWPNL